MPVYAYSVLAIGWLAWVMPFVLAWRNKQQATRVDRRARLGVLVIAISYSLLWQSKFWERSLPIRRITLSVLFFILASVLSWSGSQALGRQWRIDAGLNADHELVTWGPYRLVRHPIYTSMLCVLCATGWLVTPYSGFVSRIGPSPSASVNDSSRISIESRRTFLGYVDKNGR